MTTGHALRASGQADVLAADCSTVRNYAPLVTMAVEVCGHGGYCFTAADLEDWIGRNFPDAKPHHANVLPATLGGLAAAGRIEAVGWAKSPRTSRRSGWGRVWRLTTP